MHNLYDFHYWSKHYHEEALGEAQRQHFVGQAKATYSLRPERARANLKWRSLASLLRGVELSG